MRSLLLILQSGCFDVFLLHFQIHVNFRTNEAGRLRGVDYEMFPTIEKHRACLLIGNVKWGASTMGEGLLSCQETTRKLHVLVNIFLYLLHCQFTPLTFTVKYLFSHESSDMKKKQCFFKIFKVEMHPY